MVLQERGQRSKQARGRAAYLTRAWIDRELWCQRRQGQKADGGGVKEQRKDPQGVQDHGGAWGFSQGW